MQKKSRTPRTLFRKVAEWLRRCRQQRPMASWEVDAELKKDWS